VTKLKIHVKLKGGVGSAGKFILGAKTFKPGDVFEIEEAQFVSYLMEKMPDPSAPRPMILAVKNKYGDSKIKGAEIGVAAGLHAVAILKQLNIELLHLIDFYKPYIDEPWTSPTDFSMLKPDAKINLKPYARRVRWHYAKSAEAAKSIPSDSLEFAYIDANHSYEFVKQDIQNYYLKVKSKGILGGHDYCAECPGVIKAVDEFIAQSRLTLHVEETDWFVEKP
jgi:hypothetical protein